MAGLLLFYGIPFIGGIWYSVTDGSLKNEFVGLNNYVSVWQNPMFQLGLKNALELSLICAPLLFLLSFLLAAGLHRMRPAGAFFRSSVLMPYLMPSSAVLIIWLLWFDYGGPVNHILVALGGQRVDWLLGAELRIPVILLFLWKNLGYNMILFMSGLHNIPKELLEYADVEGASEWYKFWAIKLRYLSPTVLFVTILSLINSFKIFREVYLLAGNYPYETLYTLQHFMNNMFNALDYQKLSAAALIMAVFMIALIALLFAVEDWFGKDVEG